MPRSTSIKPSEPEFKYDRQFRDVPATQGMLDLVRSELKSEIRAFRSETNAAFASMDSKFASMDSKFASMDSKFASLDSKFASMDSKFASMDSNYLSMNAKIDRMLILMEEQRSENRVALEGLTGLWQRQARLEFRMNDTENLVGAIARAGAKSPGGKTN